MKQKFKSFRIDEEVLKRYDDLKSKEKLTNDTDFFARMLEYTEMIQSNKFVPIELLKEKDDKIKEKDEKLNALFLEVGRLQGELNIYKQQALPSKKSFWKRLFGG